MIAMVFVVLGGFCALVWWTARSAKKRERDHGEVFAPPGKLRWTDADPPR
jgi:hypothetical protein